MLDNATDIVYDWLYDPVAGALTDRRTLTSDIFSNPRGVAVYGIKTVVIFDVNLDELYAFDYDFVAGTLSMQRTLVAETNITGSTFIRDRLVFARPGSPNSNIYYRSYTPRAFVIADSIRRTVARTKTLTDSLSITDSITRLMAAPNMVRLTDSLSISDSVTRIKAVIVHLIEESATSTTSQAITVNADKSPDLDITDASIGDVSEAVYDSPSFDVSDEDTFPSDVTFSPDGLKMFVLGASSDSIYQYTLSTAWDLSTAIYDMVSFDVSDEEGAPYGFTFSPDGTKMFIVGALSDSVHSYSLATAWDISDVTYISAFNVSSEDGSPHGVTFSPDGLKMFIVGAGSDSVYQYTLSTAWDISTAVHHSISFSVNSEDTFPSGVTFSSDGLKMFIMGNSTDSVYQYSLATAWDISDVTYNSVSLDITSQDTFPHGVTFSSDGTKDVCYRI